MIDIETKICPDCFTDKYKQQMPWSISEKYRTKCPSCGSQQNTYLHIPVNNENIIRISLTSLKTYFLATRLIFLKMAIKNIWRL